MKTSSKSAKRRAQPPSASDPATDYATAVVAGDVPACKWARLACQRHLDDRARGHERGLWWDTDAVAQIVAFFRGLPHSKGEWAGKPIELSAWQCFVVGSVMGWKRADGTRRFRVAYVAVPRKTGKSTLAAGLSLYLAFFDREMGAEVYCAATMREQARIVWSEAKRMVLRTPSLHRRIRSFVGNLSVEATASKLQPLGADADNLDGLNIHAAIVDELHAHKNRAMWDVLETATGARRQPLIFAITTAGDDIAGIGYEQNTYTQRVLERIVSDDSYFGITYTIDEGDNWLDEHAWRKAIPALGVSVKLDELREMAARAKEMPSAKMAFLAKRLNVWVAGDVDAVPMELWNRAAAPVDLDALRGVPCWIGLDLASKSDLAAVVAVFVRGEHVLVRPKFYLPSGVVESHPLGKTAHFAGWVDAGHITVTDGDIIDYSVIRDDLLELAKRVECQEIDYDPFQATHIVMELQAAGLTLVEIPQTVRHLSAPFKNTLDLLRAHKLTHDGNPVMTWMASNVVTREDSKENILPRKKARHLKIDGWTAMLNALSRALLQPPIEPSVYESRGVRRGL